MQVTVELNQAKEFIWGIPGTGLMLTMADPKNVVETDKLTEDQKRILAVAITSGKVLSQTDPKLFFLPETVKPATLPSASPIQKTVSSAEVLATRAKEILEGGVGEVKKLLMVEKDVRLLRLMLALEEGTKKRVTIIKGLRERITQFEAKVFDVVNELAPVEEQERLGKLTKGTIDYNVVESEENKILVDTHVLEGK